MKKTLFLLFLVPAFHVVNAQEDLMNLLQDDKEDTIVVSATFKSTRVMNGHSVERMPQGQLDFRISHRFGTLNSGAYNFFGLDESNIHLSFEYGFSEWLMAGIGRGSYEKTYHTFVKFSLLRQTKGAVNMPVSVSFLSSVALRTIRFPGESNDDYFQNRLAYTAQLLAARKFNESISLQIMPSYVHRNYEQSLPEANNVYSVGAGGRIKLTKRISLNGEYYLLLNPREDFTIPVHDPLSAGFDIETGGHVFQLIFTNSLGMIEKSFIGETSGSWGKGDIHFGFNISRVFTVSRRSGSVIDW